MLDQGAGSDGAARDVLEAARGFLGDLDLQVVLERVCDSARMLTGARYAALGVLDESRLELSQFITSGIDEAARRRIGPLPRGRGVLGELILCPEPMRIDDVRAHPRSYGFPAGHPPMRSFLGVPVMVCGEPFGNLYLTDKAGGAPFTQQDEDALVQLAEFAGVAIDHARRYCGLEARWWELERTVRALDATVQIAQAVGGETDLEVVLALVAKRGRALVCARAFVIEQEREGETIVLAGAGDIRPRLPGHAAGRLTVPLMFRGRCYGSLVAIERLEEGPAFSAEDRRLLEAFAASAATAVATAQAVHDQRHRHRLEAAEAERARLARELRDTTLENLTVLRGALAARSQTDSASAASALDDALRRLDDEIAGLRSLIGELGVTPTQAGGEGDGVVTIRPRGQVDDEPGAAASGTFQPDAAAVLARDRLDDCQPQSGAA
jgi:GAF domain-containing protein